MLSQHESAPEDNPLHYFLRLDRMHRPHYDLNFDFGYHISFHFSKHKILRRTSASVFVEEYYGEEKQILLAAHKKFAYPTKAEAIESFRARLETHKSHLQRSFAIANATAAALPEYIDFLQKGK